MEGTVEKISADDFEYLGEITQGIQQAEVNLVAAQGALESFKARLMRKYNLKEGDGIGPEGAITRQPEDSGEGK